MLEVDGISSDPRSCFLLILRDKLEGCVIMDGYNTNRNRKLDRLRRLIFAFLRRRNVDCRIRFNGTNITALYLSVFRIRQCLYFHIAMVITAKLFLVLDHAFLINSLHFYREFDGVARLFVRGRRILNFGESRSSFVEAVSFNFARRCTFKRAE